MHLRLNKHEQFRSNLWDYTLILQKLTKKKHLNPGQIKDIIYTEHAAIYSKQKQFYLFPD